MRFAERIETDTDPDLPSRQSLPRRPAFGAFLLLWFGVSAPAQPPIPAPPRIASDIWFTASPSADPSTTDFSRLSRSIISPDDESSVTQLYDRLNAPPAKWFLDHSDCDAKVIEQTHLPDGGIDGRQCELIRFSANNGSEAILVYPIEPIMPLDSLTASVAVMSAKAGARIGMRIRFPYVKDESTHRSESIVVYGAGYENAGSFARIGVGSIERAMRIRAASVRQKHGVRADLKEPYVDAIVINAYAGAGETALRIDELRVTGMLPISLTQRMGLNSAPPSPTANQQANRLLRRRDPITNVRRIDAGRIDIVGPITAGTLMDPPSPAFDRTTLTKIIQHNGEPLRYLRTLGFDGVLLRSPPDQAILREAMLERMLLYAPPPDAPDPELELYLEPVAAWYIGSGQAVDATTLDAMEATSRRLRRWPSMWRRPLLASPLESFHRYYPLLDAMVRDFPTPVRSLSGSEIVADIHAARADLREDLQIAVGVGSLPPEALLRQVEAVADGIGAPRPDEFRWHAMFVQAMQSLQLTPSAILYRSTRSLTSGSDLATQRASALSYTNRLISSITPWLIGATVMPPPPIRGADYHVARLSRDTTDVLVLSSAARRGSEVLAGDGDTITIQLSPEESGKTFWRVSHFSAERLTPQIDRRGAELQIVSPDVVEVLVVSSDPSTGGRLAASSARFAVQASQDRWQLTNQAVRSARNDRQLAVAAGLSADRGAALIGLAEQTLESAEGLIRSGDTSGWFRQARRTDAWVLRSRWQLAESLMPDWPMPTSSPPMDLGAATVQAIWRPLMDQAGWGPNRLTAGGMDSPHLIGHGRWELGHRQADQADSQVAISRRGAFSGAGALQATVTPRTDEGLPGGYAGTAIQIRSPGVELSAGTAVRIDAMVRTLGFGRPHQGVLVYDTIGGQAMGVLVRGRSEWTPVRLYRQALRDGEVRVMFELIGGGEALIDDVQLSLWEPGSAVGPTLRPIRSASDSANPPSPSDTSPLRLAEEGYNPNSFRVGSSAAAQRR